MGSHLNTYAVQMKNVASVIANRIVAGSFFMCTCTCDCDLQLA